jgi:choline dehydrogenase-like flavoprotein
LKQAKLSRKWSLTSSNAHLLLRNQSIRSASLNPMCVRAFQPSREYAFHLSGDHEMTPGNAADDGEALRTNIVTTVDAYQHPTSTVPMGTESDLSAVVNAWGEVRGIEALRVVDASILPDIPSVPTNVTTIMVAERIAARLSR